MLQSEYIFHVCMIELGLPTVSIWNSDNFQIGGFLLFNSPLLLALGYSDLFFSLHK